MAKMHSGMQREGCLRGCAGNPPHRAGCRGGLGSQRGARALGGEVFGRASCRGSSAVCRGSDGSSCTVGSC